MKLINFAQKFSGRIAFTVLLIIIIIHLLIMSFYINDNRIAHRAVLRDAVIQKIVNVVNLIYATPVENRSKAIAALTDPYLTASITQQPEWQLQFSTASYWQLSDALRHQLNSFAISIRLHKNQWLNISATFYSHFLMNQVILFTVEILIFAIILLVMWSFNRYTRPILDIKKMAERLGVDIHSQPLPVSGPSVVREATRAINQMRQRIQDLIRNRTQMLAAISHDLRTPITRMKLRTQFVDNESIRNNLMQDLNDMELMVNETLNFARDDYNKEVKRRLDIVSLLRSVCDERQDLAQPVKFYSRLGRVAVDGRSIALKRAVNNLINNALQYAATVIVTAHIRNKMLVIKIKDNGPGIAEEDLERVFEPFYRSDHSRSKETGGCGLGLAVTREIIHAHGGKIYLKNRSRRGLVAVAELPID